MSELYSLLGLGVMLCLATAVMVFYCFVGWYLSPTFRWLCKWIISLGEKAHP